MELILFLFLGAGAGLLVYNLFGGGDRLAENVLSSADLEEYMGCFKQAMVAKMVANSNPGASEPVRMAIANYKKMSDIVLRATGSEDFLSLRVEGQIVTSKQILNDLSSAIDAYKALIVKALRERE